MSEVSFDNTQIAFESYDKGKLKKALLLFSIMNRKFLSDIGTSIVRLFLKLHLPVKGIIKKTLFQQFCGGESIEECKKVIKKLDSYNIGTILDFSIEGKENASSSFFKKVEQEILNTINIASDNKSIPFCVFKLSGLASFSLLEKIQSKKELTMNEKKAFEEVKSRVENICSHAHDKNVRIFIDAEESWIQKTIDQIAVEMMIRFNRKTPIVFNTYQLYLKEKLGQLKDDFGIAKKEGFFLGAKLVRGAYLDKERARAREKGYDDPIQPNKSSTDNDFNSAVIFCLDNVEHTAFCLGTHNEESCKLLTEHMAKKGIDNDHSFVFYSQLYGMSDHISFNLSNSGFNVAKYVPYGPIKEVMPYLFRRAEENSGISDQGSRELNIIKKELQRRKSVET